MCSIADAAYPGQIENISSITPIKKMASIIGWDGTKTDKDRKFLSDLKNLVTEYNDGVTDYLIAKIKNFEKSDKSVLFIHIREPAAIEHLKTVVKNAELKHELPIGSTDMIKTLLIKRDEQDRHVYGNESDDKVENYTYDFIYKNNKQMPETEKDFLALFDIIRS